ncbi:LytR C-terminal domain-containing protein [Pseudarthrobacter sp. NamB4]|uniref:LytR C-terminal domain-containing protein n=1 Tax=Pseudarthrobacter sp. NamB4 TaxID=2576837 RepID=UPI0010FF133D|nr:LytR C-terminal domain-containing protein [Pseudarthrobacter sp. NamB4]TLM75029.1 LytR family transcriptional regulator [Pseudarthrobacter sp. NamB4]
MARNKQQDPSVLHGHHVVTGSELRATFDAARDADDTARIRRRSLHGVVLVLLIGLIVAAIITALAIIDGRLKIPAAEPAAEETVSACPDATFDYTPNDQINLNVYNSTSRPGLARTVADEFLARKFVVGAVSNIDAGYRGVAAVISGAAGQAAAFSVQRNLAGSDYFQDGRLDGSVDVILAQDYRGLTPPELVDQTPGTLSCPRESRRIADDQQVPVVPTAAPTP